MKSAFKQVALVGKHRTPVDDALACESRLVLADMVTFLQKQGCRVFLEKETALITGMQACDGILAFAQIGVQCDLVIVLGGDGTMLEAARQMAPFNIPLIGVNQGRLGFITDIGLEEVSTALVPILAGHYDDEYRPLMHARVMRGQECIFETQAMNDVVVCRVSASSMVELRVEVDGHFVAKHLADGLIVASPTGSTAYSLSTGGPILHPGVAGWVLTPIAPHMLSNRPIVLRDSSTVALIVSGGRSQAAANFDMQSFAPLEPGDRVEICRSQHSVRLLHPCGWSYFDTLREKLRWNESTRL